MSYILLCITETHIFVYILKYIQYIITTNNDLYLFFSRENKNNSSGIQG